MVSNAKLKSYPPQKPAFKHKYLHIVANTLLIKKLKISNLDPYLSLIKNQKKYTKLVNKMRKPFTKKNNYLAVVINKISKTNKKN